MRALANPAASGPRPLLVAGDAFADLVARVPSYPHEGGDAHARGVVWSSGGSAANVAVTVASLGGPVRLLARVGEDPAAAVALGGAGRAGVDLGLVQRDPAEPTGLCFIVVSGDGERTFFSARGASERLAPPQDLPGLLAAASGLHLSGYPLLGGDSRTTALALVAAARRLDLPVSVDLCLPLVESLREEMLALLPRLAVVFGNSLEVARLTGRAAGEAASELVARGAAVAVEKAGGRGCVVASRDGTFEVPAFPVAAVDTTGCGDAFVGGFLYARSLGAALPVCGALGNAVGALAATVPGSGDALPGLEAVRAFVGRSPRGADLLPLLPPPPHREGAT